MYLQDHFEFGERMFTYEFLRDYLSSTQGKPFYNLKVAEIVNQKSYNSRFLQENTLVQMIKEHPELAV